MDQWFQICNLRTTLLHMQFLHSSLQQKIYQQQTKVERSHKDRLMQYSLLWQDYLALENSNFKKLIIIKLESCLATHQGDSQIWDILDQFKVYTNVIEEQMLQNMSKLYIGKKVLFNIEEVEEQLIQIESKIVSFMNKYSQNIDEYQETVKVLESTRGKFEEYITQLKNIYKEIEGGYSTYLKKRLLRRSKEIDKSIKELRSALLS